MMNIKTNNDAVKRIAWRIGGVRLFSFIYGHPCEPWNCPKRKEGCDGSVCLYVDPDPF